MTKNSKITIIVGVVLSLALVAGLVPVPTVTALGGTIGGLLGGIGTPPPPPLPQPVPVPAPNPPPAQTNCIQAANALFNSQVSAAIQLITQGALTHNPSLTTAGTTALNTAISQYNAALARCNSATATPRML
jgi:hypothetical protein